MTNTLTHETTSGAWRDTDIQEPSYLLLLQPFQHVTTIHKWEHYRRAENCLTGSGLKLNSDETSTIRDLRNISGLTWELLAKLFGVSRRALHLWDNGSQKNDEHEYKLGRTMKAVKSLNRGDVAENRRLLLTTINGQIPFDLLKEGQFNKLMR